MKIEKEQLETELLACLQEQIYPGELNAAGLILIGLYELEGDFIKKIIKEEFK